jgi:hypothetical protein
LLALRFVYGLFLHRDKEGLLVSLRCVPLRILANLSDTMSTSRRANQI